MRQAWCSRNVEAVVQCFVHDALYEDLALGATMRGHDEVRQFASGVFSALPDFGLAFDKLAVCDTWAVSEWTISGTVHGEFEGIDCSGKRVCLRGFSWYEFRDGLVSSNRDCWDYTQIMLQLGVPRASLRTLRAR